MINILGACQLEEEAVRASFTLFPPPQLQPYLKGGAGAELLLPIPPPLEDHPLARRGHAGPLRCPNTIP